MSNTMSLEAITADHDTAAATGAAGSARHLRRVLAANATTSAVAGLAGLVGASWWSDTLGIPSVGWIQLISAGLVLFGLDVGLVAVRASRSLRSAALVISAADLAWVAATAVVLATVELTTAGWVLAVVVAADVAAFALLQLRFRSRIT